MSGGDRPTGAELLAIAAQVLRRDVLAHVPPDKRLETLMVLRAMAIAGREFQDAGSAARASAEAIGALYDAEADGRSEPDRARLVADIRAGRFDADDRARALHAALLADVTRRVRIANPKYLETAD